MTSQDFPYLDDTNEHDYGSIFIDALIKHFGLPPDIDPAAVAKRAYLIAGTFDAVDLRLLRAERRSGKPDSAAGWVQLDQVAQLYNIMCNRLRLRSSRLSQRPYMVAGLELGCHGSRIFPRADQGRRQVHAVLVLPENDERLGGCDLPDMAVSRMAARLW